MKSQNRKHFYSYKKWFIWERHRDVISVPVKGSRASRSYEICLKPTVGKKGLLFQFKKTQVIQLHWACGVKLKFSAAFLFFKIVYFKFSSLDRSCINKRLSSSFKHTCCAPRVSVSWLQTLFLNSPFLLSVYCPVCLNRSVYGVMVLLSAF